MKRYPCCRHCQDGIHCVGKLYQHRVPCRRFGCDMSEPLAESPKCGHCGNRARFRVPCLWCPSMVCPSCVKWLHRDPPVMVWEMP